jgi:hypothetical protein
VSDPFGDHTEIRAFVDRRLYALIYLTVADGIIQRLHVIADPDKLEATSRDPSPMPQ